MKIRRAILFFLLSFYTLNSISQNLQHGEQPIIDINTVHEKELLGTYFSYFEDAENIYDIRDIVSRPFTPIEDQVINFGLNTSTYWLKFSVGNNKIAPVTRLLDIQKPLQDSVLLFYRSNQKWHKMYSGYMINKNDHSILGTSLYFPIEIPAEQLRTYYLKVDSKYGKSIAATMISRPTYQKREQHEIIAVCILIGSLLTIAIFNLLLGYKLKDWLYPLYALAVTGSLVTQLTVRGFSKMFLFSNNIFLLEWTPPFFIAGGTIVLSLFCIRFLNTKKFNLIPHYILLGIVYYMAFAFLIEFFALNIFGIRVTNKLVVIGLMTFGFTALYAGITTYRNGNKSAKYFIYAWTLYCITIVIYVLTLLDMLPINGFTTNAYMVGSIIEAILLSLALGDRYNRLKQEKQLLNERLIVKDEDIELKKQEIITLMTETAQHLKNKAQLAENLKKLALEEDGVTLKSILADLRSDSYSDSKSLLIKENIESYHLEFITKLKMKHPELSKTDIEIASLSKLKLSRREIANLRGTSLEAVKSAKARLKKKLNLPLGTSIDAYMSSL